MELDKQKKLGKVAKTAVAIFLMLIVVSVVTVLVVNTLMEKIIHRRNEVITPDIEGLTMREALKVLAKKNLSLMEVAEKYDMDLPAGSIISQSPPPGLTIREGRAIEAVISSGGKVVFVPDIKGKPLRQAELNIRQSSLIMGEQIRTYSNSIKRDHIVSQYPEAGEIVERNSYVNIVISRGPAEEEKIKKMPNILGRKVKKVEAILKEIELEISAISIKINDELPEGTVVSQTPPEGTIVDRNTRVELAITNRSKSLKEARDITVYYELVQSGISKDVKIILTDDIGERAIFEEKKEGGSKIEKTIKVVGAAKIEIYVEGILVKEELVE